MSFSTNTEMKLSATLLALASGQTTVSTDTATAGTAANGAVMLGCTLDDSILDCSPSGMSLDVPVCALEALGFASDAEVTAAFALGNEWTQECQYSGITDMGGYHFVADHSQCDISTASNETHIFYQGALRGTGGFNNGIISRERVFELNLQCDFSRESTVSIDSFFTPIARNRFEPFPLLMSFNMIVLKRLKLCDRRTGHNRQSIQSCDESLYR